MNPWVAVGLGALGWRMLAANRGAVLANRHRIAQQAAARAATTDWIQVEGDSGKGSQYSPSTGVVQLNSGKPPIPVGRAITGVKIYNHVYTAIGADASNNIYIFVPTPPFWFLVRAGQ